MPALFAGVVWDSMLDGSMRSIIERQALVPFLQRQRWFGGKARPLAAARFVDWTTLRRGAHPAFLTIVEAEYRDGGRERYVAAAGDVERRRGRRPSSSSTPRRVLARITGARKGVALRRPVRRRRRVRRCWRRCRTQRELPMRAGQLRAGQPRPDAPIGRRPTRWRRSRARRRIRATPRCCSAAQLIMKLFRRVEPGPNPDVEIGEFLTARGFARVPPLRRHASRTPRAGRGRRRRSAMLQEYVWNQGNGWQVTIEELRPVLRTRAGLTPPDVAPRSAAGVDRSPSRRAAARSRGSDRHVSGHRPRSSAGGPASCTCSWRAGRSDAALRPGAVRRRPTSTATGGRDAAARGRAARRCSNARSPRLDERRRELGARGAGAPRRAAAPVRRR